MLAILSPAKDIKALQQQQRATSVHTQVEFLKQADELIDELKKFSKDELAKLMKISDKLALLNCDRYANWQKKHSLQNSIPAMYAFSGEAYRGLDAQRLSADDAEYAQQTLRILSGLYGVIRPLDLIQPYRLEMGTSYGFRGEKNLYGVWTEVITKTIDKAVGQSPGDKVLVNVASNEYSKAINFKSLKCKTVNASFYEDKNGQYKMITVYAKKARGQMARFIIENRIEKLADLKAFDTDGYFFSNERSTNDNLVFVR